MKPTHEEIVSKIKEIGGFDIVFREDNIISAKLTKDIQATWKLHNGKLKVENCVNLNGKTN
jgi:hypothetical protein